MDVWYSQTCDKRPRNEILTVLFVERWSLFRGLVDYCMSKKEEVLLGGLCFEVGLWAGGLCRFHYTCIVLQPCNCCRFDTTCTCTLKPALAVTSL